MRLLVTGDRDWQNPVVITTTLWGWAMESWTRGQPLIVIHGGARGADRIAGNWVDQMIEQRLEVDQRELKAHWRHTDECPDDCTERVGKIAGPIRNGKMLKEKPQLCLAFHDKLWTGSKGTRDMVEKCHSARIPVIHIERVR